jgi:parallel beta-helix repeat protein
MTVKLGAMLLAATLSGVGVLALMEIGPAPLLSDTVYVSWTGDCGGNVPCVRTITEGLGNVSVGGTIIVFNGTYNETLDIDIPVAIRGESRDVVTVDGGWVGGAVVRVGNRDVTLEGLTLVNDDYGVEARKTANLTLTGLRITSVYGGVLVDGVDGFVLEDSDVVGVEAYEAVNVSSSINVRIGGPGNNVSDNQDRGILVTGSREILIADNVLRNNRKTGLNVSFSVNVTVANNVIEGNGASAVAFGTGPAPLQGGGSGGLWFWETDPTAVESNTIEGNFGFGMEIGGRASTDYTLRGNAIRGNDGPGLILTGGPSRLDISGEFSDNRGHGIVVDNVTNVAVHDATVRGNVGFGVRGQQARNVAVTNSLIANNTVVTPFAPPGPGPTPFNGGSGGLWFWETDPSEIRGNTIADNGGAGITLLDTLDFDVLDNVIERNAGEGILLVGVNRTRVAGNRVADGGSPGTALIGAENVVVEGNAYANLAVGILVRDGCHIRIGANGFDNVARPLQIEGSPCDLSLAGLAKLRFTPRTLNLKSQGQYVTVRFEVEGLDPTTFDLSAVRFDVNGVLLTPPPGSPSTVTVHKGVLQAMVKLSRAEAIAAFGTAGTYTVTAFGELMPGVSWSASDTVDAILP